MSVFGNCDAMFVGIDDPRDVLKPLGPHSSHAYLPTLIFASEMLHPSFCTLHANFSSQLSPSLPSAFHSPHAAFSPPQLHPFSGPFTLYMLPSLPPLLSPRTYMFTYSDAQPFRPSLIDVFEEYWRRLPAYQGLGQGIDQLEFKRLLFAFFPTYKSSPLTPAFDR